MLCGSLRTKSSNSALLRTVRTLVPDGFSAHYYDGMDQLPHFNPDLDLDPLPPAVVAFRERVAECAAVLICTPEYAGALPGSFKNLLDWTVGGVEIEKPTAWINVSPSLTRAADAHASLRKVLTYTGANIVEDACVHIPVRPDMLDEGIVVDDEVRDRVAKSIATLVAHSATVSA